MEPNQRLKLLILTIEASIPKFAARFGLPFKNLYTLTASPQKMRKAEEPTRDALVRIFGISEDDLFPPLSREETKKVLDKLDQDGIRSPGLRLKALREANGWTLRIFERRLKRQGLRLRLTQLSLYERSRKHPEALRRAFGPTQQDLAQALNVTVRELSPLRPREEILAELPQKRRAGEILKAAMRLQFVSFKEVATHAQVGVTSLHRYIDQPGLLEKADAATQTRLAAAVGLKRDDLIPGAFPDTKEGLKANVQASIRSPAYADLPLGPRLKRLRGIYRLSQKTLAKRSQVDYKRFQKLEEKPLFWRSATVAELWRLARQLHLPLGILLSPLHQQMHSKRIPVGALPTPQALSQPQTAAEAASFLRLLARRTGIPYPRILGYLLDPTRLQNAPMKDAVRMSQALGIDLETLCAPGVIFPGKKFLLPRTEPVDLGTQGPGFRILSSAMLRQDPELGPFARLFDTKRFQNFAVRLPIPTDQDGTPLLSAMPQFRGFNEEAIALEFAGVTVDVKAGSEGWELSARGVKPVRIFYSVIAE